MELDEESGRARNATGLDLMPRSDSDSEGDAEAPLDTSHRELLEALSKPATFPHDPSAEKGIEHVETHISHLFLTRDRVYKFRKTVRLPFLSFETREARIADCVSELRLNRRLSPEVYLGLASIEPTPSGFEVGALIEPEQVDPQREICTVMVRLEERHNAKTMLERGTLAASHLELVADRLADFHASASLGTPAPGEAEAFVLRVEKAIEDSLDLARTWPPSRIEAREIEGLARAYRDACQARSPTLRERHRIGRLVDGHGDLHLEHVWFDPRCPVPQFIDCLEFDAGLRSIDVAAEIAFLLMDLEYRGESRLADDFLAHYARRTDDFLLFEVIDLFLSHRALIRGTVAAIAGENTSLPETRREAAWQSAVRHFDLASAYLAGPRDPGCILLCGTVGSGKSSVARSLGEALPALVLSSDETRKRRAGLAPTARLDAAERDTFYSAESRREVYEGLIDRAACVLRSGRSVILDATFSSGHDRALARELAMRLEVPCVLVESGCDPAIARGRLEARQEHGQDASDAGPERLEASLASFEAPSEWPTAQRWKVETDREDWRTGIPDLAAQLRRRFRAPRG